MDPRDALNITIKAFGLKAADIARASGISVQMLSRYRKKHQDMTSLNAFQVVKVLPADARNFFWTIFVLEEADELNEKIDSAESKAEMYNLLVYTLLRKESQESWAKDLLGYKSNSLPLIELAKLILLNLGQGSGLDKNLEAQIKLEESTSHYKPKYSIEGLEISNDNLILIEDLVVKHITKHLGTLLQEELVKNFDQLKPTFVECLTSLLNQEDLDLIVKKSKKR